MANNSRGELALFAGRSGMALAERVASELTQLYRDHNIPITVDGEEVAAVPVLDVDHRDFANSEYRPTLESNTRGKDVYYIQRPDDPTSDRSINDISMEMFIALYTLKGNARGSDITAVVPCMPYSRQDHAKAREPLSAKWMAETLALSGANHVITADLHSKQGELAYDVGALDNLLMDTVVGTLIERNFSQHDNLFLLSPDASGASTVEELARKYGAKAAIGIKTRDGPNKVAGVHILARIKDGYAVIIDDMCDTAGSIVANVNEAYRKGIKGLSVIVTHGLMNEPAEERLRKLYEEGKIDQVIATDSVEHSKEFMDRNPWYKPISIAPMIAQAIFRNNQRLSVSEMYTDGSLLYRPLTDYATLLKPGE